MRRMNCCIESLYLISSLSRRKVMSLQHVPDQCRRIHQFPAGPALDLVAAHGEVLQVGQRIGVGFRQGAADGAIARHKFFVFQLLERSMNAVQLIVDDGGQPACVRTADAHRYFAPAVVLNHLGPCTLAMQHHAGFPNQRLIGNQPVLRHDEARDETLGHEIIFVAQDQVVLRIPFIVRLRGRE
jgi:hypothetical protein